MNDRFIRKVIRSCLFACLVLAGCSSEQPASTYATSNKPELLRSIDNSLLSVVVRIDNDGIDYNGEQRADGSWFVRLNLSLDEPHTYVANWYGNTGKQKVLLLRQSGSFFASSTDRESLAEGESISVGDAFDEDCDGISNLAEFEAESDPLVGDGSNCNGTALSETDRISPTPDSTVPDVVEITGGCFQMGSSQADMDRFDVDNEHQHEVCVETFDIGRYEVTFEQYNAFTAQPGVSQTTPDDKDWGQGTQPVINVRWIEAIAYTRWLSRETGQTYRLPTEAEWEYAARGNSESRFWTGSTLGDDHEHISTSNIHANGIATGLLPQNTQGRPILVGWLKSNDFGLYDMLGNVSEYTCSLYSNTYDGLEQQCDDDETQRHVGRGGSFFHDAQFARAAYRGNRYKAYDTNFDVGFRVVREKP